MIVSQVNPHSTYATTVVLVPNKEIAYSETFIHSHIDHLRAGTIGLNKFLPLTKSGNGNLLRRTLNSSLVMLNRYRLKAALLRYRGPVLIEYGTTAARALPVLRNLNRKFVVHFHGYDAHRSLIIEKHERAYREIFHLANAIVVVSRHMWETLVGIGAPVEKLHYIVYGIDPGLFKETDVSKNQAVFFCCGRFVEKKAPHLTIQAFHLAWQKQPGIQLRMAGDGPLRGYCEELISVLALGDAVQLLGELKPETVASELRTCRAFIQHSVTASDGDSEGTPVAILEAMSCGVPVISTRHAGISDIVGDGETGILCEEHDVDAMAQAIVHLASDPEKAGCLGKNAHAHVAGNFTIEKSIERLRAILYS